MRTRLEFGCGAIHRRRRTPHNVGSVAVEEDVSFASQCSRTTYATPPSLRALWPKYGPVPPYVLPDPSWVDAICQSAGGCHLRRPLRVSPAVPSNVRLITDHEVAKRSTTTPSAATEDTPTADGYSTRRRPPLPPTVRHTSISSNRSNWYTYTAPPAAAPDQAAIPFQGGVW
jgi:hypothetical protein